MIAARGTKIRLEIGQHRSGNYGGLYWFYRIFREDGLLITTGDGHTSRGAAIQGAKAHAAFCGYVVQS